MVVLLSWLARIAFWLLAFVLSLFLCVWWVLSSSIPDYSEALKVAGISAPVEIVRDRAGVPHVFAQTDEDVFFGLGIAQAQDRLWQMTMLRRTAQGRLSEIFGSRTLPVETGVICSSATISWTGASPSTIRCSDRKRRTTGTPYMSGRGP